MSFTLGEMKKMYYDYKEAATDTFGTCCEPMGFKYMVELEQFIGACEACGIKDDTVITREDVRNGYRYNKKDIGDKE